MAVARRSPPTERVVRLLDYFAARPGQRFGLSALARELDLSKPTCLGILTELTAGGYVVRDPRTTTYRLGPAMIAAGRAAGEGFGASEIARTHLEELSARYEATCTASAVVDGRILMLQSAGPGKVRLGETYPFAPPVGLMYVLWDADSAFDAWLATPPAVPVRLDEAYLRRVVAECREHGYLVESLTSAGRRLYTLMAGVAAGDLPPEVRGLVGELVSSLGERVYLGADLEPRKKHAVSLLAAPTFDAAGRQELVLTLSVGEPITGAEIARRGAALAAVADAVTAEAGGVRPARA
ncbi:helix-turn-helix domain-containing protein [Amycolatopsis echigonensis]|uniref:DNA-binding IclR family transcriptional regulator n=1 Tax=Amycolatopsis echigonensis TaxID=2576905 RepID=A0A2N3WV11_9PSEU|nr:MULTISPECIES: helix-turn-helix domain-containing protein [Amycolatopsis]MBB2497608.1 helix-turn-helix domain-containing protein [Amycolatopsis echigonensis]PKV97716.1 DNA-binding IclR family transcriptional regulator [Amycolatopsis niigatensis]